MCELMFCMRIKSRQDDRVGLIVRACLVCVRVRHPLGTLVLQTAQCRCTLQRHHAPQTLINREHYGLHMHWDS